VNAEWVGFFYGAGQGEGDLRGPGVEKTFGWAARDKMSLETEEEKT
jgi:hypothetical protein